MGLQKRKLKKVLKYRGSWDVAFELNKGEGIFLTIEDVL
jgi:hypothetical protein